VLSLVVGDPSATAVDCVMLLKLTGSIL